MPKFSVKKQSNKASGDAFNKVKSMLSDDRDLKKLDPSFKCDFNDANLTGTANGKMFKANMFVRAEGSGCEVEIVVDLPFALALAKGMVQRTLQKKLDESLT